MGDWYWIGLSVGLGVALGTLAAALLGSARVALPAALVLGGAAGLGVGLVVAGTGGAIAGTAGGIVGAAGAGRLVRGALERGGTRGATALLVGGGAFVLAALALVPAVGYLEALAVPALAVRARRRGDRRYAGLRTLARD